VHPIPEVDITYSSACQFDNVDFSSNALIAQGSLVQFAWYTDGQLMGASADIAWTFNTAGDFEIGVQATSDQGCLGTDTIDVTIHPVPQLSITTESVCLGETAFAIVNSSIPSDDVLLTSWFVNDVPSSVDSDTISVLSATLNPIEFEVSQFTNAGCEGSASQVIEVYELPTLQVLPTDLDYCIGDTVFIGCIPSAVAPQSVQNTQWTFSNGLNFTSNNGSFTASVPGAIDATVEVVTDFGCTSSFVVENYLVIHPDPVANFSMSDESLSYYEDEVDIYNRSSANVVEWSYVISDGFFTDAPNFSHRFDDSGNYSIRLAVKDVNGCVDTTFKSLDFSPDLIVHIPNSFTPDADGLNDLFLPTIVGDDLTYYRLIVFDRWGTIIFESLDKNKGWLGDVRENGYYAICDAYNYMLEVKTDRGYENTYMGAILLLR
jgi:gliding motility-associated-like protein